MAAEPTQQLNAKIAWSLYERMRDYAKANDTTQTAIITAALEAWFKAQEQGK